MKLFQHGESDKNLSGRLLKIYFRKQSDQKRLAKMIDAYKENCGNQ
jgi:hypothetical protein